MRKSVGAAAFVALACVVTVAPAAGAPAAAEPSGEGTRTVFIGDSYTANFGIAPTRSSAPKLCFRAADNYPAVATRALAAEGVPLDVQADVSCGGAEIHHVWEAQGQTNPPQKDALRPDTQLVVGSLGGNTMGFAYIMKQCSKRLRGIDGALLPVQPVDKTSPASACADFFQNGKGADWIKERFEKVRGDLDRMFRDIGEASPGAETVLVGYPRIVPEDTAKCAQHIPGSLFRKPLADINMKALKWLDKQVQEPLNDLMKREARRAGATFVDIYGRSGTHTACDGKQRGIGAMLERSEVRFGLGKLPWFVHPNRTGRDLQARLVADTVKNIATT